MSRDTHDTSLLERLLLVQPVSSLRQLRRDLARDLERTRNEARRLADEVAQLDRAIAGREGEPFPLFTDEPPKSLPLQRAILYVLDSDPSRVWHRDDLYEELVDRGWGPGGSNPRNTYTSRLRELEKVGAVIRHNRHEFQSARINEEVATM